MFRAKNYVKAASLQEAWELNQKRSNVVLGGFLWLKMGDRNKQTAIDLSQLELDNIEETAEEFIIGAMCTLRLLELHEGLNHTFNGLFRECTRHIVGVQFRNCATVGGSVFGRFGFSDIITALLCLDTTVELYQGGMVSLAEFVNQKKDNDILVKLHVKKDERETVYITERQTKTDFPMITCGLAKTKEHWVIVVGARPQVAKRVLIPISDIPSYETAKAFSYGKNLRASAEYRCHLAGVCIERGMEAIRGGKQ